MIILPSGEKISESQIMIGIIGAFFGGVFAIICQFVAHLLTVYRNSKEHQKNVDSILQAIQDEVEVLWGFYYSNIGSKIEELGPDQPLLWYWVISQEYFLIYKSNVKNMGDISNRNLRKAIVLTYARLTVMFESCKLNSDLVHKIDEADMYYNSTQDLVYKTKTETYHSALVVHAKALKMAHEDLKKQMAELHNQLNLINYPLDNFFQALKFITNSAFNVIKGIKI